MDADPGGAESEFGRGAAHSRKAGRRPTWLGWRFVVPVVVAALLITAGVRAFVVDVYYIPSGSMEPLLQTGDRILVSRTDYEFGPIRRGDVVVFDGRGSFAPYDSGNPAIVDVVRGVAQWVGLMGSDTVYVKRVIGMPGDHVTCCDGSGRVTVNGNPTHEPYIYGTDAPSATSFDVVVPPDRLWLMGDHRSVSADSRSLLAAPGGGFVPMVRVIGRPIAILWPPGRAGGLDRMIDTAGDTRS